MLQWERPGQRLLQLVCLLELKGSKGFAKSKPNDGKQTGNQRRAFEDARKKINSEILAKGRPVMNLYEQ